MKRNADSAPGDEGAVTLADLRESFAAEGFELKSVELLPGDHADRWRTILDVLEEAGIEAENEESKE